MKIALLSFHNAYNYGAALQAYALQEAVKQLGVQCEYIDYTNEQRKHSYDMKYQFIKAVCDKKVVRAVRVACGSPFIMLRGIKFKKFYRKNLIQTKESYSNVKELKSLNSKYDRFIVGSDQVWNPENNGEDWVFLLNFVEEDDKKISYSSSFGISEIPKEYEDSYRKYLGKFKYLAVREQAGVNIISDIIGRKAHLVLDPVFLVGKEFWSNLKQDKKWNKNPFIFFYTNKKNQIKDFLETEYATKGQELHVLSSCVGIKDFISRQVKVKVSMSPEDFLDEINMAELVVTASFHCLAFAIIYHKQFCVILTGDRGKDERVLNLLKLTNLESRILNEYTTSEDIDKKIDYDTVDKQLEPYLRFSKEYLKRAIFSMPDIEEEPEYAADAEPYFCMDGRCTGCTACQSICPVNAISMRANKEGFLTPYREEKICVECGACHNVCQVFYRNRQEKTCSQTFWAVKNKDEVRLKSSSGGVFSALADIFLQQKGIVVAAAMDEKFSVRHDLACTKEQYEKMRGTFYVQSDLNNVFRDIKDYLQKGTKVLFVGTPCQVQGLRNYIGDRLEGLVTCDLICHGVPSPRIFSSFIQFLFGKGKLSEFRFRDKSLGWRGYHVSAVINGKKVQNRLWLQSFNNLFSHNIINRYSCSSCPYSSYDRCGDITIGDFWGIEKSIPGFSDGLGISLVICNTKKGESLLENAKSLMKHRVLKEQTVQNSLTHPAELSAVRKRAFNLYEAKGYESLAREYGEWNLKGWMKNCLRKLIGC